LKFILNLFDQKMIKKDQNFLGIEIKLQKITF